MDEIEKFYNLENALQDAILSEKTAFTVYDLGEKNGLSEDKIREIGRLTKKVLMKELPIKDFEMELELRTGLSNEIAKDIAEIIDKEIFEPVKIYFTKKEISQNSSTQEKKEEPNVFTKQKHIFKNNYREPYEE
ncbi:MAG TPA: hypothetical protein PKU93_02175 [Candidatus Pacearchaeota archaeon]|nr:hypothetical protein [Candidatus Pacearchaeota archaeon]